nr:MAG TPA: hypothetical protein [Caudoviricetes sp.]
MLLSQIQNLEDGSFDLKNIRNSIKHSPKRKAA